MKFLAVSSFCIFVLSTTSYAVSLLEALNANGASEFAKEIQANPEILALYTSPAVRTVYAVPDISNTNRTLRRRQKDPQQLQLQCSGELTDLQTASDFPGTVSPSNLNSSQLQGPQSVVSQSGLNTGSSSQRRRQATNATVPSTPVTFASGLGNQVNLVSGDIAYDGGLIHIVDGFFTIPVSFAETVNSTGLSSFQAALAKTNLSDTFNSKGSITIFTPSDDAFAAAAASNSSQSLSGPELQQLLLNHVIPDFTGYLPNLKDGAQYTTLAGSTLTVTIKNNAYFINGVQITSPNVITANGVSHVINGILKPIPIYQGAAWSLRPAYSVMAAITAVFFVQFSSWM